MTGLNDFGLPAGLSVRVPYSQHADDEIRDRQYAEQTRKQNEAMQMAKVKMLLDDVDFQNGSNPYDAGIIKQESQALVRDLGNMTRSNPDWMTNLDIQAQMKQRKSELKSTPAVLRSIAYKDSMANYQKFLLDAAKNPNKYNMDDLHAFGEKAKQYANYDRAAVLRGETPEQNALYFDPPQELPDMEQYYVKSGSAMEPDEMTPLHNGRTGAYTAKVSDAALNKKFDAFYASPENKKALDYLYTKHGQDPREAFINSHKPYTPTKRFEGYEYDNWKEKLDYAARLKAATANAANGGDPYIDVIVNSDNIAPDDAAMAATFGSTPTVKFKGPDGKQVTESGNRFYYTQLSDKGYRGKDKNGKNLPYTKNGLKVASGFVVKPLEWAEQNNILEDTKLGPGTKWEVKPDYKDTYELWYPEGKDKPVIKIHAQTEVNANSKGAARQYNAYIHSTTKQREGVGNDNMIQGDVFRDEAGNMWTAGDDGNYVFVGKQ